MQNGQSSRGRERLERAATTRVAIAILALNGATKTIEKSTSPYTIELVRFPPKSCYNGRLKHDNIADIWRLRQCAVDETVREICGDDGVSRDRLRWFALGAAVTSLAAVLGLLINQNTTNKELWTLLVWGEGRSTVKPADVLPLVRIAMGCDAKVIDANIGYSEGDLIEIPLAAEKEASINCLLKRAKAENLYIEIVRDKS